MGNKKSFLTYLIVTIVAIAAFSIYFYGIGKRHEAAYYINLEQQRESSYCYVVVKTGGTHQESAILPSLAAAFQYAYTAGMPVDGVSIQVAQVNCSIGLKH